MCKSNENLYIDLGFAKLDSCRASRNGYPEVIYGDGKTPQQVLEIFKSLSIIAKTVICTKASKDIANLVINNMTKVLYYEDSKLLIYEYTKPVLVGKVVVATGGTSDIPVAEEASLILEAYGSNVVRLYDVGVAGIGRLLSNIDIFNDATCIIAVAGMEGALVSVIGGLVSVPVIGVPTSIGYGTNLKGFTPLLTMLNSCSPGISVVNINNGFGAAVQADMINKLANKK